MPHTGFNVHRPAERDLQSESESGIDDKDKKLGLQISTPKERALPET